MSDKNNNGKPDWLDWIGDHGFRVFAAFVTGALTFYAGNSVANSVVYGAVLVLLAEGVSLYWPFRLETAQMLTDWRKLGGAHVQWISAILGITIAWISIILTDLASAILIANQRNIGVFALFATVPEWAQAIMVYVLPVLAFTHGLLLTAFYVCSAEASHKRLLRKIQREARQAIAKADADAEVARSQSYQEHYRQVATPKAQARGKQEAEQETTRKYSPLASFANEGEAVGPLANPTPPATKRE